MRCPFHLLREQTDFSPMLISRIQAVYTSYRKSAACIPLEQAAPVPADVQSCAPAPQPPKPKQAVTEPELLKQLKKYFEDNRDSLITLNDAVKAMGGKVKKTQVLNILQNVAWCKAVDKATFFYVPMS